MPQLFVNNVGSFLDGAVLAGDTTLSVSPGSGSLFPTPTGGDFFLLTLTDAEESVHEIVKVVSRSIDTLGVVRAQEGTTAIGWISGSRAEVRLTAGTLDRAEVAYGWGDHALAGYSSVTYVDSSIAALLDTAPATLDTLNELAAALGDDPNFATTVSTQIGTKLDASVWSASAASGISSTQVTNWDAAVSWGNHASAGYAPAASPTFTGLTTVAGRIAGGFGADTTAGTGDWNDAVLPGTHSELLLGGDLNGPGVGGYYHAFNFEYSSKDGTGNITQLAIPYSQPTSALVGIPFRYRSTGAWSAWFTLPSLDTSGNLTVPGDVTGYSDGTLKDDVETVPGGLTYLMRGVTYSRDGNRSAGVIAQELERVAPELVREQYSAKYKRNIKSVNYNGLAGYFIETFKRLNAQVATLEARIEKLEGRL